MPQSMKRSFVCILYLVHQTSCYIGMFLTRDFKPPPAFEPVHAAAHHGSMLVVSTAAAGSSPPTLAVRVAVNDTVVYLSLIHI